MTLYLTAFLTLSALAQPAPQLKIEILGGEGAINYVKSRTRP